MDLFWNFWSLYNWILKVVFILTSATIVYWMKWKHPYFKTYDEQLDDFKIWIVLIPPVILALFFNVSFTPFEVFWAFSIYLEVCVSLCVCVCLNSHILISTDLLFAMSVHWRASLLASLRSKNQKTVHLVSLNSTSSRHDKKTGFIIV